MVRMVLACLLGLLAVAVAAADFSAGLLFAVGAVLVVPAAVLFYFGWYARLAKTAKVTRAHGVLVWGLAVAAFALLLVASQPRTAPNRDVLLGSAVLAAVPILLVWYGSRLGSVELMPKAMRTAAREAAAKSSLNLGEVQCAVCKGAGGVHVYYYYAPVQVEFIDYNKKRVTYDSDHCHGVSICDACLDRKRSSVRPAYWLGLAVSVPACAIFVGIFGVVIFWRFLYDLRNREEVGDVLAYHWRAHQTFKLGWLGMEGNLTRKGFGDAKAREGREWHGGKTVGR